MSSSSSSAEKTDTNPDAKSSLKLNSSTTANAVANAFADRATGRLFVVTGAYSGIGVETVKSLLSVGATVVAAGRTKADLDGFVSEQRAALGEKDAARIDGLVVDLGDLSTIRAFAAEFLRKYTNGLDVLINNAGVMNTPQGATAQGFETQFGVNVVGTFLLTELLLPAIQQKKGRVIFLSSVGHSIHGAKRIDLDYYRKFKADGESKSEYNGWVQYQQSKLGDILLAKEFHRRHGVETAAVHPGFINTNLNRHATLSSLLAFVFKNFSKAEAPKSTQQGAATTVLTALMPQLKNGAYFADCAEKQPNDNATHEEDWKALYDYCVEVTKI